MLNTRATAIVGQLPSHSQPVDGIRQSCVVHSHLLEFVSGCTGWTLRMATCSCARWHFFADHISARLWWQRRQPKARKGQWQFASVPSEHTLRRLRALSRAKQKKGCLLYMGFGLNPFQTKMHHSVKVASPDDCFLVCPVSGRCFPKSSTVNEEAWLALHTFPLFRTARCKFENEEPSRGRMSWWNRLNLTLDKRKNDRFALQGPDTRHEWERNLVQSRCSRSDRGHVPEDPELSAAQQVGRWFEQGSERAL